MAELDWRGPKNLGVAGRRRPFDVEEISDELRKQPGTWAMIYVNKDSKTSTFRRWFGSGFEIVAQNVAEPGKPRCYEHFIRFIGKPQAKEPEPEGEPEREPGEVKSLRGAYGCGKCKARFTTPALRDQHERACKKTLTAAQAIGR